MYYIDIIYCRDGGIRDVYQMRLLTFILKVMDAILDILSHYLLIFPFFLICSRYAKLSVPTDGVTYQFAVGPFHADVNTEECKFRVSVVRLNGILKIYTHL